ncbi:MAG: RnfABCDGE type electron transport complex subunit G [Dysgonamonadaceae bacterium]|jgi:electron transport complex protein RnfG|nr:RnfABCDGE type electron transport complex subunit G [Dysgonamonadaceae bacterium]
MKSTFKNMFLSLTLISLFAAAALAAVYNVTKEPIEQSKTAKKQSAIKEVLPEFARLDEPERVKTDVLPDSLSVYRAYDSANRFVGAAVESSANGFGGEIKIMVGFDVEGKIVNYSVLEQKETPGLGTQIIDWFKPQTNQDKSLAEKLLRFEVKSEARNSSVIGKNPAKDKLTVSKDKGDIDAITAATISSRAFLEAVRNAYAAYAGNTDYKPDAESGASMRN